MPGRLARAIWLALWLLALAGCASAPSAPEAGRVERDLVYTPAGWPEALAADVWVPGGAGPFPAVLVVHGGGWEAGRTRQDMERIAAALAGRGFVAVNVSYRLAPAYRFPAPVHDLQQAVRWLRANAARWQVDPSRVGAWGYSAGGHLVAMLATLGPGDALDAPWGGAEARLQAAVAGGAPTDLRKFPAGRLVPQFLGGRYGERPDLFAAASPVLYVSPDDPPMFLYHAAWDRLVPKSHALDMKRALDEAGVPAELMLVRPYGHISAFLLDGETREAALGWLERWLGSGAGRR